MLFISATIAASAIAAERPNLLLNSDLTSGGGETPDHWRRQPSAATFAFEWLRSNGLPGQLMVTNSDTTFAQLGAVPYWSQKVNLDPGWYYLSAGALTQDYTGGAGAMLIVCDQPRTSNESGEANGGPEADTVCGKTFSLHTTGWQRLATYIKVDRPDRAFDIRLAIGPRSGATKGYFRDLTLLRSARPPTTESLIDFQQLRLWHDGYRVLLDRSDLWSSVVNYRTGVEFLLAVIALTLIDSRVMTVGSASQAEEGTTLCCTASKQTGTGTQLLSSFFHKLWRSRASVAVASFFSAAFFGIFVLARIEYLPSLGFVHVHPGAVSGDEPHYLMITNSLLFDKDLEVQDDYERVAEGGLEAGARFRGTQLDHHTVVINRRTGHHATGAVIRDKWQRNPAPEFAPSKDVYEVSAHPITFPTLLALVIWPFGPTLESSENEAAIALGTVAWLGVLSTYFFARRLGLSRISAMGSASLLLMASPWLAYARSYFREPTIGLSFIMMLWAAVADWPISIALSAALAAALKPAYIFVGGCFVGEAFREGRWKISVKIGVLLAAAMLAFVIFSLMLRRTIVRSGWRMLLDVRGRFDTLFDSRNGLFVFVPWTALGLLSCFRNSFSFSRKDRPLRLMAGPLAINLFATSAFAPGDCYGPRYWIPFLPWLAIASIVGFQRSGFAMRTLAVAAIVLSVTIAIPGALSYPELFNKTPLDAWRLFWSTQPVTLLDR